MPGGFLLHQHDPEDDVQDDQPKRHVKDAIVPGSGVHGSAQHGRYEDRYGHTHRDVTHRLADRLRAYRVGQKRQTDGPDDGGGKALQEAADDEENESGAETEEESGTEEGEESDQEGKAPGGRVVGEITTYGCRGLVCCRRMGDGLPGKGTHTGSTKERCAVDGEEDGDPVLDCSMTGVKDQKSFG